MLVRRALFLAGVALIGLNTAGSLVSLRNPELRTPLSPSQVQSTIDDARRLPVRDSVRQVTQAVSEGMADHWDDVDAARYNVRIPPWKNYLLYLLGRLFPEQLYKLELYDASRAIERGVGLCSQHAIAVAEVLEAGSVPSRVVGLGGHVVATALVDREQDRWWIVDPQFGVVVEHDVAAIEREPGLVAAYYSRAGVSADVVTRLVQLYGPGGNRLYPGPGARGYSPWRYGLEKLTYVLIWVLPLGLVAPLLLSWRKPRG